MVLWGVMPISLCTFDSTVMCTDVLFIHFFNTVWFEKFTIWGPCFEPFSSLLFECELMM